jgi:hypothetical protein
MGNAAMTKNFHEQYSLGVTPIPSERSTGLIFAAVFLIIAYLWRANATILVVAMSVAGVLLALSLMVPKVLRPLNLIWFRLGLVLHRAVNPLVMLVMFVVVFVPAGLIMRIWHDPLRSRRASRDSTYWIERQSSPANTGSMSNQF